MSDYLAYPLCRETDHWNSVIALRCHDLLVAVTALEFENARRHLMLLRALLSSFSEIAIALLDELQDVDADAIKILRADHLILGKTANNAEQLLDQLETLQRDTNTSTAQLRSQMVHRLDGFIRLNNILDRHQQRQQQTIFPQYINQFDIAKSQHHADILTTRMKQAMPH